MSLHSRKGFVKASYFYTLIFVAQAEILGMVSPPDMTLMTVQAQTTQDRKVEADRLLQQGTQQYFKNQYREAAKSWQNSLELFQSIKDLNGEGLSLKNLGGASESLGQYQKAIDYYQQSLVIFNLSCYP